MAKIVNKVMWFSAVEDADSYIVRMLPEKNTFNYEHEPTLVLAGSGYKPGDEVETDLSSHGISENVYDIYITARDSSGNESDPFVLTGARLDFTPPPIITSGGFR